MGKSFFDLENRMVKRSSWRELRPRKKGKETRHSAEKVVSRWWVRRWRIDRVN